MAPRKPSRKPAPRTPDVHIHMPPNGRGDDDAGDEANGNDDDDDGGASMIEQAEREVRAQTQEIDSRVVVRLYRKHPQFGNRRAFLVELEKDDFSQDGVQELYGGGHYWAEFFGPIRGKGGKPGRGPIRTIQFDVDLSIPPKSPTGSYSGNVSDAPTAATPGFSRIDALMESGLMTLFGQMQRANEMQAAAVQRMLEGGRSQVDWGVIIAAASPIVVALLESMTNRPDPMKAAREIAELASRKSNPLDDVKSLAETIAALREMSGSSGVAESDPDTPAWLRILERTAAPLIARAVQNDEVSRMASAVPDAGAMHPPTPHNAEAVHPQALPPPAVDMARFPEMALVAPLVPNVEIWAGQGRSAEWAAETVLYDVPAGFHRAIAERLAKEDFVSRMVEAFPQLTPFREWLGEFRGALLEQLSSDGSA